MAIPPVAAPQSAQSLMSWWARWGRIAICAIAGAASISVAGVYTKAGAEVGDFLGAYAGIGGWVMIGYAVLLYWRHHWPVAIMIVGLALTMALPTSPVAMLIALAAVVAARPGWLRWVMIVAAVIATAVSMNWDLSAPTSYLSNFVDKAPPGSVQREGMRAFTPVLAIIATAPFAAFGMAAAFRGERDDARASTAAATRNVQVLHREVERERERQELARELHDTLAAKLSAVSLHAGALELAAEGDQQRADAARLVREAAQGSLDDLRNVVHVLRHPEQAKPGAGLADLETLLDEATRQGGDVRVHLMVSDPSTCDARVSHALYRVVQESLSNARRHAPGSPVWVDVRGSAATGISVSVTTQQVANAVATSTGGGHGLSGMSERIAEVGGTFQAGETPEHTFVMRAWLPWLPGAGASPNAR